jgi:hypothetical protein
MQDNECRMSSEKDPRLAIKDNLKNVLLEIADPKMMANIEKAVDNLTNLAMSNPDLGDDMLQNLILRQVFNICDRRKLGQARLVSRNILNQLRRAKN